MPNGDERIKLGPIQSGVRKCWVTVLHDNGLNVDVLIGAGTKEACMKVFDRLSGGVKCDEHLVYHVAVSKTDGETS